MVLFKNKAIRIRPALLALFCLWLMICVASCTEKVNVMEFSGETMGTSYHVTVVDSKVNRQKIKRAIEASLFATNQKMSHYQADSEISELSHLPIDTDRVLSDEMAEILSLSQDVSNRSGGAFDITLGPLVDLWGFGPGSRGEDRIPSDEEVAKALARIGYQSLLLNGNVLRKTLPVVMNLSAVAKGYGVDQVAEVLSELGAENFLIEVGGEMYLRGSNARGKPWRIAIEKPSPAGSEVQLAISVTDQGVATSGSYRNYFTKNGFKYSHTIDPRVGRPVIHQMVSVTVIADNTAEADAWATAISVLGPEQGLIMAEKYKLAIYVLIKDEAAIKPRYSSAFSTYVH